MEDSHDKISLRNLLLEKRDNTSFDLLKIASKNIQNKLRKNNIFTNAEKIGAYYPIGSEILTQDIIQELLSIGKQVFLPKTVGRDLEFKRIIDFSSLEMGNFGIMEPKENCQTDNILDVILVPTIGITTAGMRLGYGHGFYDRFLAGKNPITISLVLEKQIVKNIPKTKYDVMIDWIVTEDRMLETCK